MKIARDSVVSMDYKLTSEGGEVLEDSAGEPLTYLHGHDNLIDGLEEQLEGLVVGDARHIVVPADKAYGPKDPDHVRRVSRASFPAEESLEVGMRFTAEGEDGATLWAEVIEVTDKDVLIDENHPLAGQALTFDIKVLDVRVATETELDHGHVHDGHHDHDEDDSSFHVH